jgi:hypothetical protein
MTEGPEVFIGRIRGEAKQLYSFWSKGIHCEFFAMGSHTLDDVTCIDKLRRSVHIVIEAAFVSQFVLSPWGTVRQDGLWRCTCLQRKRSMVEDVSDDSSLLLAAEECPREDFERYHTFTRYERSIINRLTAHGPVLLRGGRGSGKSALLIESYLHMKRSYADPIIPVLYQPATSSTPSSGGSGVYGSLLPNSIWRNQS